MPRGNKTGPAGDGSMTGRAQGYCTGNNQPGFISNQSNQDTGNRGGGRGRGAYDEGRGMGRGMGRSVGGGFGRRSGQGSGQGFGFRQGYQNTFNENYPNVNEKTLIENDIRILKDQLTNLEKQLSDSKDD